MKAAALLLLLLVPVGRAEPLAASPVRVYAGGSVTGFLPTGDEIKEVYRLGPGVGVEFGLSVHEFLRFAIGAAPSYSSGDPQAGPLAANASGKLWTVPFSAGVQLAITRWPRLRPYVGAGLTALYVHENLSFSGPLGTRDQARSYTPLGVHGQVGIEQNRPRRLFAELWYFAAEAGGVEGDGFAREAGGIQLRAGYRGDL